MSQFAAAPPACSGCCWGRRGATAASTSQHQQAPSALLLRRPCRRLTVMRAVAEGDTPLWPSGSASGLAAAKQRLLTALAGTERGAEAGNLQRGEVEEAQVRTSLLLLCPQTQHIMTSTQIAVAAHSTVPGRPPRLRLPSRVLPRAHPHLLTFRSRLRRSAAAASWTLACCRAAGAWSTPPLETYCRSWHRRGGRCRRRFRWGGAGSTQCLVAPDRGNWLHIDAVELGAVCASRA